MLSSVLGWRLAPPLLAALRRHIDTLKFVSAVTFALAVMVSAGPMLSVGLPLGPSLTWKRVVPADIAFALLVAVWLIALAVEGAAAFPRRLWRDPLVLLTAIAVAVVASPAPTRGVPDLARFAYSMAAYLLIAQLPLSQGRVRRFAAWYVAGATAICVATLAAYLGHALLGWQSPLVQANSAPGWQAMLAVRAMGPFAHPTTLAVFLNSATFFACLLLTRSGTRGERVLVGLATGLLIVILLLTASRAIGGVLLSVLLVSLLSAHRRPWQIARTLLLGELVLALVVLSAVSLAWNFFPMSFERDPRTRFATFSFYTAPEERALIYRAAVRMFLEHPLVGVGPGLFEENVKRHVSFAEFEASARFFYDLYDRPERISKRYRIGPDPHSSWLGWLARAGLIGLGAMCWFFAQRAVALSRAARRQGTAGVKGRLAFAFLMGFLYDGFAVEVIHLRFFWIFLGFTAALVADERPEALSAAPAQRQPASVAVARPSTFA